MKKTINVAIGGCCFIIDEDAYDSLNEYLECFKSALEDNSGRTEIMEELEGRIADLLKGRLAGKEVVNLKMVEDVTGNLGYPQTCRNAENADRTESCNRAQDEYPAKKLFRSPEGKKIAGVCSGLSLFFGIDVVLIRIIFLAAIICGMAGGLIYIMIWIAAPEAKTAAEKCELRGIPVTAENISRFTKGD